MQMFSLYSGSSYKECTFPSSVTVCVASVVSYSHVLPTFCTVCSFVAYSIKNVLSLLQLLSVAFNVCYSHVLPTFCTVCIFLLHSPAFLISQYLPQLENIHAPVHILFFCIPHPSVLTPARKCPCTCPIVSPEELMTGMTDWPSSLVKICAGKTGKRIVRNV